MRVFLDATVLFSARNPGSAFQRAACHAIDVASVVTNEVAVAEARKNLALKRAAWFPGFEVLIERIELVPTVAFALPVELAAKDVPLLCSALRAECDLFVTGDRMDFGELFDTDVLGVRIVTPLELGRRLQDR
jgi:hypothetical protein